jgi:plastocyanin
MATTHHANPRAAGRGREVSATLAGALLAILGVLMCVPAVAADSHDVAIVDYEFRPAVLTVLVGEPVTWTNQSTHDHNVTSDAGAELDSGNLAPGEAYGHVFDTPGTYRYHSANDPTEMTGTIIVELPPASPAPSGEAPGTPPPGTLPPNFSPFPSVAAQTPAPASSEPTATPAATAPPGRGGSDAMGAPVIVGALAIVLGAGLAIVLWRRRRADRE